MCFTAELQSLKLQPPLRCGGEVRAKPLLPSEPVQDPGLSTKHEPGRALFSCTPASRHDGNFARSNSVPGQQPVFGRLSAFTLASGSGRGKRAFARATQSEGALDVAR